LNQETVDIPGAGMPVDLFIFSPDRSHDLETPDLSLRVGKPEALERDCHFDSVPFVISFGVGEKICVPVSVESEESSTATSSSPRFSVDPISLDSAGIDLKDKSPLFVVEGIEVDREVVVTLDRVPLGKAGSDALRVRVKTAGRDVEVFLVVPDINDGSFCGPGSFLRFVLRERVEDLTLFPERILQTAVDLRGLGEFRNFYAVTVLVFLRKGKCHTQNETGHDEQIVKFRRPHRDRVLYTNRKLLKTHFPRKSEYLMFLFSRLVPKDCSKRAKEST